MQTKNLQKGKVVSYNFIPIEDRYKDVSYTTVYLIMLHHSKIQRVMITVGYGVH